MTGKNRKTVLPAAAAAMLAGACFLGAYLKRVADYKREVAAITITEADLSGIGDGIYTGDYNADLIYAKVAVTVQDGKITDIELLEHKNERGKAAESIPEQVVHEQKIDVDAVSGATNSSRVIKKAIENALTQSGAQEPD